jgi:hypothetical protein
MKQNIANSQDFHADYQQRHGSRQGLNNKENVCQNTIDKKSGLNKLTKFIK